MGWGSEVIDPPGLHDHNGSVDIRLLANKCTLQLPGTLEAVPAALLSVQTLPDGTQIGRFRYGDRYLQRR